MKKSFSELIAKNKGFLANVYGLLAIQLIITFLVINYVRQRPQIYNKVRDKLWLWFVVTIILIIVMSMMNIPWYFRILFFSLFSVMMGFSSIASSGQISESVIKTAIMGALTIFVVMSIIGFVFSALKIDLSYTGFLLLMGLIVLIVTMLIASVMNVSSRTSKILLSISLVLFAMFVVVDTNKMLMSPYKDVVNSAVGLYLDILNTFTSLLGINLGNSN